MPARRPTAGTLAAAGALILIVAFAVWVWIRTVHRDPPASSSANAPFAAKADSPPPSASSERVAAPTEPANHAAPSDLAPGAPATTDMARTQRVRCIDGEARAVAGALVSIDDDRS